MATVTDAGSRRPVIVYSVIAVILFAAMLSGLFFAKNRSDFYANKQLPQNQTNQAPSVQQPEVVVDNQNVANNPPAPSETNSNTESQLTPVKSVPATGPELGIMPIIVLSGAVFTGISYVRSRRRLRKLA